MRAWGTASIAFAAATTVPGAALADERDTFRLDYVDAAGACPSRADVEQRLARAVGYVPVDADASRTITIAVGATAAGFEATMRDGDAPPRAFAASVCDDLIDSVVLAVALALDPEPASPPAPTPSSARVASPPVPRAAPTPPDAPNLDATPPDATPPDATPPDAMATPGVELPAIFGFWGAGAAIGAGVVPGVSFGPLVELGLGGAAWEISLEGTFVVPGTRVSSPGEVVVSSLLASAVPCWAPRFASWGRALVCGNLTVGGHFVDAVLIGDTYPTIELAIFTGPRAGMALDVAPHFDVRIFAELVANVTPLVASIEDGDRLVEVFRAPPVAGRTGVSGAVTFP